MPRKPSQAPIRASAFSQRKLLILNQDTPAQDVARAMRNNHVGCVLLGNKVGDLTGIVTDRDFACRLAADHATTLVPVFEFMTRNPVAATEETTLEEILDLMEGHGIRRIPVIAPGTRHCVGLVSLDALISLRLVDGERLGRIVRRQVGAIRVERRIDLEHRRSERSESRRRQALARFYKTISQETDLPGEAVPRIAEFLLESVLRRIPYGAAMNFASQLPLLLRQTVLTIEPGPDREVTGARIVEELVKRYQFTEEYARSILSNFFEALRHVVDPAAVAKLEFMLPEELIHPVSAMHPDFTPIRALLRSPGSKEPLRMEIELTSPAFEGMQEIPAHYTGDGEDMSPPLQWSRVPKGVKEYALLCEDPDAPSRRPWAHWVLYGISPTTTRLPQGVPPSGTIVAPVRCHQGLNSSGTIGYSGPFPPKGHGWHRYVFKIYALDKIITLPPGATREELVEEIMDHVISEGVLIGRYRRDVGKRAA